MLRIALLDDYQGVALRYANWRSLPPDCEVQAFQDHLTDQDALVARLQGFPDHWEFCGGKTAAYRQVGNAFPPPVAKAVAVGLSKALIRPAYKTAV